MFAAGVSGKVANIVGAVAEDNGGAHEGDHEGANAGVGADGGEAEVCAVCLDGDIQPGNDIILCDNEACRYPAVHLFCYGLARVPEGDWKCRQCEAGLTARSAELQCCVCEGRCGGTMKATNDGRWAHVKCALHCQEVEFGDDGAREPIVCSSVGASRPESSYCCGLCMNPSGATRRCAARDCARAFHVPCAMADNAARAVAGRVNPYDDTIESEPYCARFMGTCARGLSGLSGF